ncbi:alpha-L-rhamnosidase [Spirochaetia bacterium]|nr:alpha-L-rhamnosidase [Spirochaetia bacterium]
MLSIRDLKTEYRTNPVGIDVPCPRFSWILESDQNDTAQVSYTLNVIGDAGMVWDSGIVQNDESVLVEYAGPPLCPRTLYQIVLEVMDNHGNRAAASGSFETGLMKRENFKGCWITDGYEDKTDPCPVFIRDFSLKGKPLRARIYTSALGIYDIKVNGKKAGNAFFAPGWTSYRKRIQYQCYDITELLREENRIEITVAKGWFSGELGFVMAPNHYGSHTALWAQIEASVDGGGTETIATDEDWQYGSGPVRYAEIYHGETIDRRCEITISGKARLFDYPLDILTAQESEPVRITERLKPVKKIITPKGETVFDFGQNLTGVVEARLDCLEGTTVILRHAEVLDKDGNFYTENLRQARAVDTLICKGGGEEIFLPSFTFHGFRYIKVEGMDNAGLHNFTACVMHTDMEETGAFECSHAGVNRLRQNIRWSQRGNFLDIPTDCPQRDERLGWTGDAQMFAGTAAFNYDVALFFTKWLRDLKAEQTAEHGVPHVIPNILGDSEGAAAWSDAATIIPWTVYQTYKDKRLLSEQYESMKRWVEYIRSKAGDNNLWQSGFQYADWLALDKEESSDRVGATDVYLVATAYYACSTAIVARAAKVLDHADDAKEYDRLHRNIIAAFQKEYITQTGRMVSETQTGCVLALHFGLADSEHRPRILQSLVNNLAKHNSHLTTGFVGTPYLCHTLSENGQHDLAGTVFLKQDYPSWLYAVNLGATTIWERWNSMKADGAFDESGMNSFNHYAYGAIGSWMYQKIGGLSIVEPGYKKSRIAPMPIKGITHASTSIKTVYGELSCRWQCKDNMFTVDITVPCNTSALVNLPGKDEEITLGSGSYHYEYPTDLVLELDRYSMESTLGEIFDNPVAMGILKQYAPEIADNPMIRLALGQTIAQLVPQMPQGGAQLFEMVIQQCNEAERQKKSA